MLGGWEAGRLGTILLRALSPLFETWVLVQVQWKTTECLKWRHNVTNLSF